MYIHEIRDKLHAAMYGKRIFFRTWKVESTLRNLKDENISLLTLK